MNLVIHFKKELSMLEIADKLWLSVYVVMLPQKRKFKKHQSKSRSPVVDLLTALKALIFHFLVEPVF